MNPITVLLSVIFAAILLIEPIFSANDFNTDVHYNKTVNQPNGLRFQRILHRKKRFLLFPPGSAVVTTLSFTKTLVPKSPSGINMIGECDIFYPLQTKIEEWYPPKRPLPPPPPPPPLPALTPEEQEAEDIRQGVLPANVGPLAPVPGPINPVPIPPVPLPQNNVGPAYNGPFIPSQNLPNGRLPSDQELGITPGTLVSDPNFNVGSHPGEVYVDENAKISQKTPPRRYYNDYSKQSKPYYQNNQAYYQYPYYSSRNSTGNSKTYNDPKSYNHRRFDAYKGDKTWSSSYENAQTMQRENSIKSDFKDTTWSNQYKPSAHSAYEDKYRAYSRPTYSRASRERRDLFDQLESFMTFKKFDTRSCILRMICEAKHYLLPPGKSLFQDIFRVLFTLPLENEPHDPNDEYVKATLATEDECDSVYSKQCRFSVLGFLMNKDRPIL